LALRVSHEILVMQLVQGVVDLNHCQCGHLHYRVVVLCRLPDVEKVSHGRLKLEGLKIAADADVQRVAL
jgi:hypothetical protein